MQQALDRIESVVLDRRGLGGEDDIARRGLRRTAIHLRREVRDVVGLKVDDVLGKRFVHPRAYAFAHRVLGPLLVAAARLRDVHDVRHGVVLDLRAKVTLDVIPVRIDRVRRADVGSGCHCGDVPRERDEGAG